MDAVKLAPAFPPNREGFVDGRTWDSPIFWCWLFGHRSTLEVSADLRWTWHRCSRCGCRDKERLTDLRWLELWGRRVLLTALEHVPDTMARAVQKGVQ